MLVGRSAERRRIDEVVAGARVGRAGALVICGEAGIGKTTLLHYAVEAASDVRLLHAVGSEAEADVPFGGLSQLLRPTADDLDRLPAPQAEALAIALALRPGAVADRLAVGAAVLSLLVRYSEEMPVGIVVDDAHLLDRPSAEALTFACRRFLADAVFVVVAARTGIPGALTSAGLPTLTLDGLDVDDVAELARAHGRAGTHDRSRLLHRVTGGNPLAVLALANDATRSLSGALGSPAPVAVPAALTRWYADRIAALGAPARTLLLLAAVAGGDPTGLPLEGLAEAEDAGFLRVGAQRLEFTHPLVRASVYALASAAERRAAHAFVADALPVGDDRRAWHRCEATLGPSDDLAAEMESVAVRAASRGAHAVAASAWERAARLSEDDQVRSSRLLSGAESAWRAGEADHAVALIEEGTALAPDPLVPDPLIRARGLALRGDVAALCGAPGQAQEHLLAASDAIVAVDPSRAALLVAEAVSTGFFQGSAVAALAAAGRLERLLERDLSPAAAAVGTLAVGMAHVLAGRPGTQRMREGAALLDGTTPEQRADIGPAWLMYGPLWLRESGSVRGLVRSAVDEGRARSAISTLPMLLFTLARDGATTEHWASAAADYSEAISLARELGHTTELAVSLAGLAWLDGRRGRVEECRTTAAEALAVCAQYPVGIAMVWTELALAELDLGLGDLQAVVDRLTRLEAVLESADLRDPDLSPAPELAEALLRLGGVEQARRVAARHQAAARAKGLPWSMARAARLAGLLATPDVAPACFTEALDLHAQTLDVFEEARTRLAYGACLRRARRRVEAREQLRLALHAFDRLGAVRWADATAAELDATGEHVARGDQAVADRLTPRELQIALLLVEGRTTRQTAAALFLSPKTVEYHLRHVYTKLGIGSRAELAVRLGAERRDA